MIKINGLSEERVIQICDKVAKNHQQKKFDYFTEDDIYQEAWIIILEKIDEFTEKKIKETNIEQALENFLNSVVGNRLSNFYRDRYVVKIRRKKSDTDCDHTIKLSLSSPSDISLIQELCDYNESVHDFEEYTQKIFSQLTDESFEVLESILSGQKVSRYYKQKLWDEIRDINNVN